MKSSVSRRYVLAIFIFVLLFVLFSFREIFASIRYYYPINSYEKRQGLKALGQYIDNQFYKGN